MNDGCIIPLNGWTEGRKEFQVSVGKEFFEAFDNSEILDANVRIDISVEKSLRVTDVDLELSGTLTVPCDRCLEDLVIPVSASPRLRVRFGAGKDEEEDGRETLFADPSLPDLDLSQEIYDYAMLALPLQRVHPEGGCNPAALRYLNLESTEPEVADSPFASLKGLFDEK